jgi:hypothetical protein
MGNESWGIDRLAVGSGRLLDRLWAVGDSEWGCKWVGDGLLGSVAVNSRWDMSESCSDTADNVLGDAGTEILRVDDQRCLRDEGGSELTSGVDAE